MRDVGRQRAERLRQRRDHHQVAVERQEKQHREQTQELTDYRGGKPDAVLHLWAVDYPGWTDFLPNYAPGGHVALSRQNWAVDSSPEAKQLADLTAQAVSTVDPAKRLALYKQVQRVLVADPAAVWLADLPESTVIRRALHGYQLNAAYTESYDYYALSK